ncbi:hypothetical protein ACFLIM_24710 [Nonomuraea sp. M3C6]|uniref:SPW repeat-containing protein n=1 Tax=Nonomuraea marmarensis TaxID=3351344 RepID=A0ABW7AJF1_9ACTN
MSEQQQGQPLAVRLAESVAGSILFGILSTMWARSPIGTVLIVGSTAFLIWVLSDKVPNTPAGWAILAAAGVVFNLFGYGLSVIF